MSDAATCDHCGKDVPQREWFGLEVQRFVPSPPRVPHDDFDQLDVVFCSQEHAAAWLAGPIPPALPGRRTSTAGGRLLSVGCAVLTVVVLVLLGAGLWTVFGWVR